MNRKQFTICGMIIVASTGALVGYSINVENAVLPAIAMMAGASLLYFCKTRVKEVVEDERIYRIGEKSAMRAYQVFTITAATTGVVLIAAKNSQFSQAASTLIYSVFALMALYLIFYTYYSSKGV